jgi:hypothetical protein
MASTDVQRAKIYSTISAFKAIDATQKPLAGYSNEQYNDKLESTNGIVKKTITDFTSKIKGKTQNKKDIFEELMNLANAFLGDEKEDSVNPKTKNVGKSKIFKYAKTAAQKALKSSNKNINAEVKKTLFGSVCNPTTTLGTNSISISPKEFDFLGMLKVDPATITGQLMYESPTPNINGGIKFNRDLYDTFDSPTPYYFKSLFELSWDSGQQKYLVDHLPEATRIGDFLDDYYNSIEYPDIEHVLKTSMQMLLGGDGAEPTTFKIGMKNANRLLTKLFSICGNKANEKPLLNTTDTELTEDETDIRNYFDFDDIEGIDLDDEDAYNRRVLKYRDCNNFETELNPNYPEDFAYLLDKKPLDENVINTINKAASDAYETSESGVALEGFQLSLFTSFILKIPKALVASLLSPKMFFPAVVSYKLIKGGSLDVKDLMKTLSNLYYNFIRTTFWNFIKEFWLLLKGDILSFTRRTAARILANQLKRIRYIIQILINIIRKALSTNIGSCSEIFGMIMQTITAALNKSIRIPIPGMLMMLSEYLPGYSADRAYMNAVEKIQTSGINMGPIYGTENKLPLLVKGIIDGYSEEIDTNSFVQISLKQAVIPAGPGAAIIPPGIVSGYGKLR